MPNANKKKFKTDLKVDFEGLELEEQTESEVTDVIVEPFDPTKIKVRPWNPTIQLLMERVRLDEINLGPEFQRAGGVWSAKAKSQLIESLLIRIPLPAFYFDATDEDHMEVIDGQQRLTTLRDFINAKDFKLRDLEFLTDLTGMSFDELPRQFQRRILETQITVFIIEKGTPDEVKYTIFKRINTTGLPLSAQEIRHALNQGHATKLLKTMAESAEFREATAEGVSSKRMVDRELALRFIAFRDDKWRKYKMKDLDKYLHDTMAQINKFGPAKRNSIKKRYFNSLNAARAIFDNDAFRKRYDIAASRAPVNKALFEAWTVGLDSCTQDEIEMLIENKSELRKSFIGLLNENREFDDSVSVNTNDPRNVKIRFTAIKELISEVLE